MHPSRAILKTLRLKLYERGLSQRTVGAWLGVNQKTMSRRLRGEASWPPGALTTLAERLDWPELASYDTLPLLPPVRPEPWARRLPRAVAAVAGIWGELPEDQARDQIEVVRRMNACTRVSPQHLHTLDAVATP